MTSTSIDVPHFAGAEYQQEKGIANEEKYGEAQIESNNASIKSTYDLTHRQLRPRHIQLIGIGGTIGTALYVQIGRGLIAGGPGSLFLAFTIWYVLVSSSD